MTNREVMQQALEALQLPSLKTQAMLIQRTKPSPPCAKHWSSQSRSLTPIAMFSEAQVLTS